GPRLKPRNDRVETCTHGDRQTGHIVKSFIGDDYTHFVLLGNIDQCEPAVKPAMSTVAFDSPCQLGFDDLCHQVMTGFLRFSVLVSAALVPPNPQASRTP